MAYTDADTVKAYMGTSGSGDNSLITALIARAQKAIETYTRRVFEAASDTTKTFDARADVDRMELTWARYDLDLCAITTVTNGDGTTIASTKYVTQPRHYTPYYAIKLKTSSGLIWEYDSNNDPEDAISIEGRWAWSTTAPVDIQHVTIRLTDMLYHQKDNAAELDRAVVVGNATILPAALPDDIRRMLDPYVRRT